jgi:hypothetical protein
MGESGTRTVARHEQAPRSGEIKAQIHTHLNTTIQMNTIEEKINSLIIFRQFKKLPKQKKFNMAYRVSNAIVKVGGLGLDGHELLFMDGSRAPLVISRTNVLKLLRGETIETDMFIDNGMLEIQPFNDQITKTYAEGQKQNAHVHPVFANILNSF